MAEKEYEIYEVVLGAESCHHCIFDVDNSCRLVTGGPDAPSCSRAAKAAGIPFMRAAFRWKESP